MSKYGNFVEKHNFSKNWCEIEIARITPYEVPEKESVHAR